MKLNALFALSALVITAPLFADSGSDPNDIACAQRGWQYCQLPNMGENCNVGTCDSSLSSSGNCTVEANYNLDGSRVVSCNVCSTEAIDADACRALGGTVKSS